MYRLKISIYLMALTLALTLGKINAVSAATEAEIHSWVVPAPRHTKETYFSNLSDGASIETPFVVRFGLSGMGLAAITGSVPDTGHHHLLVNRELPANFQQPLPFNDSYIHFGKGQMETVLLFKPGTYTLRLVLANQGHIPYFVYSKPVTITVTKRNDAIDPKSLVTKEIKILSPLDGSSVRAPFRIGFHASGFNVSHLSAPDAGSGHFRLRMQPNNGAEVVMDFKNGHTETWLNPPVGHYTARLDLIDNTKSGSVLATSTPVKIDVKR